MRQDGDLTRAHQLHLRDLQLLEQLPHPHALHVSLRQAIPRLPYMMVFLEDSLLGMDSHRKFFIIYSTVNYQSGKLKRTNYIGTEKWVEYVL